jgi:hypothetical protein
MNDLPKLARTAAMLLEAMEYAGDVSDRAKLQSVIDDTLKRAEFRRHS